jgi:pimeloyl-ACP methyl ester carboxylesterase
MTTGVVASADGTPIGYLRTGRGPAVVALHGSNESARSHTQFALALADEFTVCLADRRGRGLSGPHRPDHSMRTEVEDLQAVVAHSGAQKVFGVSVSALITLQAARTAPAIRQVAVYEPALLYGHLRHLHQLDAPLRPGDDPRPGRVGPVACGDPHIAGAEFERDGNRFGRLVIWHGCLRIMGR